MKRPYLRITPGEESLIPGDIPDTIASLHKLTRSDSDALRHRLNPFHSQPPPRFEFVALNAGENESVEFFYGADEQLDALEQRLGSIYPSSYDIDRGKVDITKQLIRPVQYSRKEFVARLEDGRLYHILGQLASERMTVSDGGDVAVVRTSTEARGGLSDEDPSGADPTEAVVDDIDLDGPLPHDEEEPLTSLDRPTETADGGVYARPPLSEVEPYGVEWWGAAARRKDWMTTLTRFTEVLGQDFGLAEQVGGQSRLPLTPLVKQLAEANRPIAFQVVFQRRSDWTRDARRRSGELLDGTDTLLQKILGLESQGSRRRSGSERSSNQSTRRMSRSSPPRRSRSPADVGPSRPTGVGEASRYDLVKANTPKRTFTVNLRLLTLAVDGDEPDGLAAVLDPLRSVFDLVDGPFYEMDGRRLRAHRYLPGFGERHARNVLDCFDSRSISTGGSRFAITNRSETRPDLVLNGDELANLVIVPPVTERQAPDSRKDTAGDMGPAEIPEKETEATIRSTPTDPSDRLKEATGRSLPDAPPTAIHRDAEIDQLTGVLEPLKVGSEADTVLVTGPTGSGKTYTVKYAVDQLCQQNPGLNAVYVNCWENHSPFQTLYRILDQLESTVDIHRKSTPRDVLLDRLRTHDDQPCVAILDEVDQLDEKDHLYDLLNLPRFSLLLIVNREEDLLDGLDERLASRLGGCERISFDRYTVDELFDILRESTNSESISENPERREIEAVAEAVNGDARVAITTLRIATRRAGEESDGQITEDIVEGALPKARQEVRRKTIDGLTPDQRAVFRVIKEHGRIAPGELIEKYRERVEEPKSNRTIRNYLNKLERYDLIASEGTTRDRMYRCISP